MTAQDRADILADIAQAIRHTRPYAPASASPVAAAAHRALDQVASDFADAYARRYPHAVHTRDSFLTACGVAS